MTTKSIQKNRVGVAAGAAAPSAEARRVEPVGPAKAASAGGSGQATAGESAGAGQARVEGGILPNVARLAYESMQAELSSLPSGELVAVRVDLRRAGAIAHSVASRDSTPERRADFVKAAETGFYSIATLDNLPRVARGAWYVRRQQLRVLSRASGATLSEEDARKGYETRGRMMRVLEHWLGDRRDIADELEHLREGAGHEDLATDLDTLVEVYQRDDVRPFIEQDKKHYRDADVGDALRLVDIIFASLGIVEAGEVERANALAQRAATLLLRVYNEHRRCGQFIFGGREDIDVTYPSLITAARSPRRRRQAGAPPGDEAPGEGPGVEAPGGEPASA